MNVVARDFADGSNHVFSGCIGAVDGWIVKIRKPRKSDGVLRNLSTAGRDSTDLASRPLLIERSACSSAALSPVVLSMTLLRSRERACTNGSSTIIGVN